MDGTEYGLPVIAFHKRLLCRVMSRAMFKDSCHCPKKLGYPCNFRFSQGASTRRVHPKGVVEVFAFFGSLDGPEQNKT